MRYDNEGGGGGGRRYDNEGGGVGGGGGGRRCENEAVGGGRRGRGEGRSVSRRQSEEGGEIEDVAQVGGGGDGQSEDTNLKQIDDQVR